jgi:hypothetical protein
MQGLPSIDITIKSRRLLPYVFTFTRRQLFSVALSVSVFTLPGSSPVHCSVLSGLSSPTSRDDSLACSGAKISRKAVLKEYLCRPPLHISQLMNADAEQQLCQNIFQMFLIAAEYFMIALI